MSFDMFGTHGNKFFQRISNTLLLTWNKDTKWQEW